MPRIVFTPQLERFLQVPPLEVSGGTVGEALHAAFATNPRLRGYLLDDHGRLRSHVNVFVGDRLVSDRVTLRDPVGDDAEIYVLQALSGGADAREP